MTKLILHTDGGSRGNPGPAAAGIVLDNTKGNCVKELGVFLGKATNNEAEYQALVYGMAAGLKLGATELECYLDSELIVKQLKGIYKMKNTRLKVFYQKIKQMEKMLEKVTYKHVKRDKNERADALVNEVLDNSAN